jgi:hypothetical protein
MTSFSAQKCDELMRNVTGSQQAIQTTSAQIIFWKRHAAEVVRSWENAFQAADMEQRLVLIYLANDVVQASRVQGRDFIEAFHKALPEAFKHMVKHSDDRVRQKLKKVVLVWRDRHVWGHKALGMYMEYVKGVDITQGAPPAPVGGVPEQLDLLAPLAKILREILEHSQQGQKLASADTAARKALADAAVSAQVLSTIA